MNKVRSALNNKAVFAILLIAAIAVMLLSGVQTSRAALTYVSDYYSAQMTVSSIGITLLENGSPVGSRDYAGSDGVWDEQYDNVLLSHIGSDGEEFQPGTEYPERLSVQNSGQIDEYVRVIVRRYWVDGNDQKRVDLAPSLIDLNLTGNGWILDENASTEERMVLYYASPLAPGETTPALSDTIRVDSALASAVTITETVDEEGQTVTHTEFEYDGVRFVLEAEANGVQTHNAQEAIKSAWGVDVSIDGAGNLSLG